VRFAVPNSPKVSGPPKITEWDSSSHFLAMFAATALLKDEQPQSLLLVGNPGEGKSALVQRFSHWPGHFAASDITSDGLRRVLESDDKFRMLLLDEMQRIFAHTFDTVQNVCGLLISLMSGNASKELVGPQGKGTRVDLTGRRIGIIAAMPNDVLQLRIRDLEATGMLSRFSFLSIKRSDYEKLRVRANIYQRNRTDLLPYPIPPKMSREPQSVGATAEATRELEKWGSVVFANHDDRKHQMLTVLLRSVALLSGRSKAGMSDVRQLKVFEHHLRSLETRGVVSARTIPPLARGVDWFK
jgi:hypothetical protein